MDYRTRLLLRYTKKNDWEHERGLKTKTEHVSNSEETGLSQTRLGQVVKGKRGMTAETAVKLGKFFGIAPEFWMNLQSLYDIEEAQNQYKKDVKSIHSIQEEAVA